jgi:hypothetical protein
MKKWVIEVTKLSPSPTHYSVFEPVTSIHEKLCEDFALGEHPTSIHFNFLES